MQILCVILSLLMTSVCWGDELVQENIIRTQPNVIYKMSCPDGYELQAMLKDRRFDKRCSDKHVVCFPEGHYTDAELKCVKEIK